MTKQELTNKYNYYVRKRNEYANKIAQNSATRQYIHDVLQGCNTESNKLETYSDQAQLFRDLQDENTNLYTQNVINSIDYIFSDVSRQLEVEKNGAQSQVNYYKTLLESYQED